MSTESAQLERLARLGWAVRRTRLARDLSLANLATQCGTSAGTLARVEKGLANPRFLLLTALADALEISVDDLIDVQATDAGLVSVGYEGRSIEGFIDELRGSAVATVADVRLTPLSRKPGFSKTRLCEALQDAGIGYQHLRPLGNPKDNRPHFWEGRVEEGRRAFREHIRQPDAVSALAELAERAEHERVAVLCFERDEHRCHRKVVLDKVSALAVGVPVLRLG
jgi:transcriptional regulator with XRE-family HTH domain